MAAYGYGNVADRAFVAFDRELDEGAWAEISTSGHPDAVSLLTAPPPVVWKLRLRRGIGAIITALGAPSLVTLDNAWDAVQRRLFHRIGAGVDDDNAAVREAADRLREGLLVGGGTGQTQLDYDAEVDIGRQQIALTRSGGALESAAKKLKITDVLADVEKTTDALAQGLGRPSGEKRKSPSKRLRDAMTSCAADFNAVHDELTWFVTILPAGVERDRLTNLLQPLQALLERHPPKPAAPENTSSDTKTEG